MSQLVEKVNSCITPKIVQLQSLWEEIGYRSEVIDARRAEVVHFFGKLGDDMFKEENECKQEIVDDISESKAEVDKLCRDLKLPPEQPNVAGLPLMAVWDTYQEISSRLKGLRQERVNKMTTLYDIENPLCARLGETPLSLIKEGETPQDQHFKDVESNIQRLRKLYSDRFVELTTLRCSVIDLLDDLDVTVTASIESNAMEFQRSVVASDAMENFILSDTNLKMLAAWHAEVVKLHAVKQAEVLRLRDAILNIGRRLNLSKSELTKRSLSTNKASTTKCGDEIIDKLRQNLALLEAEKLRQLPLVIDQAKKEIMNGMERCWLGDEERQPYCLLLSSTECTDDILNRLDHAVEELCSLRQANANIYEATDAWIGLMSKQLMLEERASDPNRYKNRGGGLLQEEKERKEVNAALPKRERELHAAVNEYFQATGEHFLLCGMGIDQFLDWKRSEFEDEKAKKRELHRTQAAASGTALTAKKTGGGRLKCTPSASRLMTPSNTTRSNLRSTTKIGASTPNLALSSMRHTPLVVSTRNLAAQQSVVEEDRTLCSLGKENRKRNSGHTIGTAISNQSPAKKRCLEGGISTKKNMKTTTSTRHLLRTDLISPAPRVFASPLQSSSQSASNLKKTAGKMADNRMKPPGPLAAKTSQSRLDRNAPKSRVQAPGARKSRKKSTSAAVNQGEGYPFGKHVKQPESSVIDLRNIESFRVGGGDSPMPLFHSSVLDPDSGVLAGHSETTSTELAVDSIIIPPPAATRQQQRPQARDQKATAGHRFAIPPPQLSSTLIAHATRSQTAATTAGDKH